MSLDGIVVRSVAKELENTLINGRIDKIYQPEKDEILINIRNNGNTYKLLLSASSNNPRVYLATKSKSNPESPPMFCMLLRKHLQGGRILSITQPEMERMLKIAIQNLDELGNVTTKELIIELMGRHSNIILIDESSLKIIDSIKRVTDEVSSIRQVLPGFKYEMPPAQDKENPLDATKESLATALTNTNGGMPIFKFLYTSFMGLSPLIGREICHLAGLDSATPIGALDDQGKTALYTTFITFLNQIRSHIYNPTIVMEPNVGKLIDFSAVDITQYGGMTREHDPSISTILEGFYLKRDNRDRIVQKSSDLKKVISTKLERSLNKLAKQKQEVLEAKAREKYKIYGDLLTANIYRIEQGKEVTLENFYSDDMEKIVIQLDPRLTPSQNAQKYYKKYNKLKTAHEVVANQILNTKEEIDYLENVLVNIENCGNTNDLEEIREELVLEGFLKKKKHHKRKKNIISKPRHYLSKNGYDIYVGKNNNQNDYLTLKFASKDDIWLHTKEIPGSHVIVKAQGGPIPEDTIKDAAILAAHYSKGSMSSNVPVDYTERRNVKKPKGAKPGRVIYENNNTLYVTPSQEEINQLVKVED